MNKSLNLKIVDSSDIQDPEVLAMLQAFYSRSPMPIEERLESLYEDSEGTKTEKIRNALKTYYVDYGHASIGDCGGCTVFIENVSMLAAKAIQDNPLYVGQECSTRYIDFSEQPFLAADQNDVKQLEIQEKWRTLYLWALPQVFDYVKATVSPDNVLSGKIEESKRGAAFERTCKAIAFDYCRSLLPAGTATSLAWTASFRVFNDHLRWLSMHPLAEVRRLARALYVQLATRYPKSFKQENLNLEDISVGLEDAYATSRNGFPDLRVEHHIWGDQAEASVKITSLVNQRYRHPADHSISFEIKGLIDFGSFRDLARHRPGLNKNALLTSNYGFHDYYSDAFASVNREIMNSVDDIRQEVSRMYLDVADTQYLLPMGMKVGFHLQWNLGQLKYVTGLRSKTSVHPTLREKIWQLALEIDNQLPRVRQMLQLDGSPHYEASDRGEQTIKRTA